MEFTKASRAGSRGLTGMEAGEQVTSGFLPLLVEKFGEPKGTAV